MYKKHFGLLRKPFELSPDSSALFLGESHKDALAVLKHGVVSDKGFLLFTGGVGAGKTTLINVMSQTLENPGYLCVISNPTLEVSDFFYYFAAQLGLLFDGNKAKFLFLFSKLLEECKKTSRKVLLIIDEAHALPVDLLEELRLLVNMSTEIPEVLSIFLVGQPELLERLTEEQLSPLNRSIAVRFHLKELSEHDSKQYILFRLKRAGAETNRLFTKEALELVCRATFGNPRQMNILCDNALLAAYSNESHKVDGKTVRECVKTLYIPGDESSFYLPPVKGFWGKRFWLILLTVVVLELGIGILVYKNQLWQPVWQYCKQLFNLG